MAEGIVVKSGPGAVAYGLILGIVVLGFMTGAMAVVLVNAAPTGESAILSKAGVKADREPIAGYIGRSASVQ